mgnify:CR=1 FL=1
MGPPHLSVKDLITQALPSALGLLIAGGVVLGSFLIFNRFFGLFNYAQLSPTQVDKVAQKYQGNIVTKAEGANYSRGVINTGGTLYYFKHHYGKSFEIFPVIVPERYSTDTDLLGAPILVLPV